VFVGPVFFDETSLDKWLGYAPSHPRAKPQPDIPFVELPDDITLDHW
jgi:hypothetical protein